MRKVTFIDPNDGDLTYGILSDDNSQYRILSSEEGQERAFNSEVLYSVEHDLDESDLGVALQAMLEANPV